MFRPNGSSTGEGVYELFHPGDVRPFRSDAGARRLYVGVEGGAFAEPETVTVTIPLNTIYSTNGQEELRDVERGGKHAYDLEQIYREVRGGASNIFLAKADGIAQAVNATRYALTAGRSADVPVATELQDVRPTSYWLVAYLGIDGSAPPAWTVRTAERRGTVIRLGVQQPIDRPETKDMHPYFVWVPLGKLDAGKYTLELYDAETKVRSLTRRVTVGTK